MYHQNTLVRQFNPLTGGVLLPVLLGNKSCAHHLSHLSLELSLHASFRNKSNSQKFGKFCWWDHSKPAALSGKGRKFRTFRHFPWEFSEIEARRFFGACTLLGQAMIGITIVS